MHVFKDIYSFESMNYNESLSCYDFSHYSYAIDCFEKYDMKGLDLYYDSSMIMESKERVVHVDKC